MLRSVFTPLIIYNKERNDIMKIVKSLAESGLLIKDQSIKKSKKEEFLECYQAL